MERESPVTHLRLVVLVTGGITLLACSFPETPSARNARSALRDKIAFVRGAQVTTMDGKVTATLDPNVHEIAPDTRTFLRWSEGPARTLHIRLTKPSQPDVRVLDLAAPPSDATPAVSSPATRLSIEWVSRTGSRFLILDRANKDLYYIAECTDLHERRLIAQQVDTFATNGQHVYLLRGNDIRRIAFENLTVEEPVAKLSQPANETLLAARGADLVICQQNGSYPPEVKPWCSRIDLLAGTVAPLDAPTTFYISTMTPVKDTENVVLIVWDGAESLGGKPAYKWYLWNTRTNETTLLFRDNNQGFKVHNLAQNVFESPSQGCEEDRQKRGLGSHPRADDRSLST